MKVDTRHDKYILNSPRWQRIKDCVAGQDEIKAKSETYLPKLNGQDPDAYKRFLQRAQFKNFTGRTESISLGQVFRKDPLISGIDNIYLGDITTSGQSFYYFSREVLKEIMETNRCGILVDWSDEGNRPYLTRYGAESIINWREERINGTIILSLVVLEGWVDTPKIDDMFMTDKSRTWFVLWLDEGVYTISRYKKGGIGQDEFIKIAEDERPIRNGKVLDYIPFYFCTSQGISTDIEKSILYDFANINIGHYVNSADYENMLHWTGAKTLVTKGFGGTESVPIGGSFDLPTDGDAFYLEAASDSGLKEEMIKKEENMAVMGATLISGQGRYIASSESSRINSQGEYASLADVSKSLSNCMTQVLKEFAEWINVDTDGVSVKYNVDFELAEIEPATLTAFMGAVQSGFMSWEVFFYNMKNKELYPPEWTIDDELKAIEERQQKDMIEVEDVR